MTVDDIAKVVAARFATVSGDLPGGGWFGRAPDAPAGYPYAVFTVESGPKTITTGTTEPYVQTFTVRAAAYATIGASGNDPNSAARAINTALGTYAAHTAIQGTALRNAAEKIKGVVPAADKGEYAPLQREGRDVFITGSTYEFVVLGYRDAS